MNLYIIAVTKSGRIIRIQMDREESVQQFCWRVLGKGRMVKLRRGLSVNYEKE